MRNLTSIQSATDVLLDIELHIQASDVSTTWIFDRNSIQSYPSPQWEIDFTGGLGKASNYDISLASSIGFLNENFQKLNRAQAFLKVFVNSDNFTPHVGRVRGIQRDASNPNIFTATIYENFLDGDPKIPADSIVDSYATPHPEVLDSDFGYPLYYGKHSRPFYMTPVDCEIKTLLGPRNVSSENHLGDTFFWIDPVDDIRLNYVGDWAQQSGSTNIMSTDLAFETFELTTFRPRAIQTVAISGGENTVVSFNTGTQVQLATDAATVTGVARWEQTIKKSIPINKATKLFIASEVDTTNFIFDHGATWIKGTSFFGISGTTVQSNFLIIEKDISSSTIFLQDDFEFAFGIDVKVVAPVTTRKQISMNCSYNLYYQLESAAYKNYSIFNTQVNCSDVAISENPNVIIADIINQTSFNFVQEQNSSAQIETSSYNFQCFFGERESLSNIMEEFGKITSTYYWIGDSGYINTRTYQESNIVTNSIDFTITTSDIIQDTMEIKDNPIGFIFYQTEKASRIKVDYDYDYARGQYLKSLSVDKNNNSFCDSAFHAGIQKERTESTKCIIETQTASYYIDNLVRRLTTDDNIVEGVLPARFMGMELADVLHLKHPSLLNSESIYQVTKIKPDYQSGEIDFTANRIINIT